MPVFIPVLTATLLKIYHNIISSIRTKEFVPGQEHWKTNWGGVYVAGRNAMGGIGAFSEGTGRVCYVFSVQLLMRVSCLPSPQFQCAPCHRDAQAGEDPAPLLLNWLSPTWTPVSPRAGLPAVPFLCLHGSAYLIEPYYICGSAYTPPVRRPGHIQQAPRPGRWSGVSSLLFSAEVSVSLSGGVSLQPHQAPPLPLVIRILRRCGGAPKPRLFPSSLP
ncbi:hypothetical protein DPEC_G00346680 [Dallia pectoralis]|uniref:Uncharacterized protein n=1 Tax=Dallia pectoralis TaxID=75939 RepID=A0ACC2F3U7_DALPE|nr:hypothetical protein DPEC_G00346680 [Dallia pectoralis]